MSDKPECACPTCTSILAREDVSESHERLVTDFVRDINGMGLTVQDAMIVVAAIATDMAANIYTNAIKGDDDTPEAQDSYVQSFVGILEDFLERTIGIDPDEDDEEHPAAAEQPCDAADPVYVETFGGDPDTRH